MNKRGTAFGDFIYVYGWFILLVVVVLVSLIYLGVKYDIISGSNSTGDFTKEIGTELCRKYCEENEGMVFESCNPVGDLVNVVCGTNKSRKVVSLTKVFLLRMG